MLESLGLQNLLELLLNQVALKSAKIVVPALLKVFKVLKISLLVKGKVVFRLANFA